MLHYDPQHVSSSTLLIFRRTNCITTASGIVTLCKQPYIMQIESGLQSALNLHAENTHPEYVTLVAFPQQQWLHERTSQLRYTYIAVVVIPS